MRGLDRKQAQMRLHVAEFHDGEPDQDVLDPGHHDVGVTRADRLGDPLGMPRPTAQPDFDQIARHDRDFVGIGDGRESEDGC
ncbi:hypothetical protein D3C83_74980 [compost metagenome]